MNADTIKASPASCRSSSQRRRSTCRKVTAQMIVSAYVSPIRKKNGSTANDPGVVMRAKIAEPSRIVLTTARTAMSQATLRRRSVSIIGKALHHGGHRRHGESWMKSFLLRVLRVLGGGESRLSELADQVEDRHIHRDHDAADNDAENGDHDRLEERQ